MSLAFYIGLTIAAMFVLIPRMLPKILRAIWFCIVMITPFGIVALVQFVGSVARGVHKEMTRPIDNQGATQTKL